MDNSGSEADSAHAHWYSSCTEHGTPAARNDVDTCLSAVIVMNEINYNPCQDLGSDRNYEFVELVNIGNTAADMSGASFTKGFRYTFPQGSSIAPDEFVIVARTPATWVDGVDVPAGAQVFGPFDGGNLSNRGEDVELSDSAGNIIDAVNYDDNNAWDVQAASADGGCSSLELADPALDNAGTESVGLHAYWSSSCTTHGTPAAPNDVDSCGGVPVGIVITEIMYNPCNEQGSDDMYEFVEIFNAGTEIQTIGGAYFSKGFDFTFPGGATIAPGEYAIAARQATPFDDLAATGVQVFGPWAGGSLSNGGEDVELLAASGDVLDYVDYDDNGQWQAQTQVADGNCASLELAGTASELLALDNSGNTTAAAHVYWFTGCKIGGTPGAVNEGPADCPASSIVITEVMYNPCSELGSDNDYEFVEVFNRADTAVSVEGMSFTEGFSYTFPVGATLAGGEYAIVARNPASWPDLTAAGKQVWGPFDSGSLSNGGENIQIIDANGIFVDYVDYDDNAAWTANSAVLGTDADGGCASLELSDPSIDNTGIDHAGLHIHWYASCTRHGTPAAANDVATCDPAYVAPPPPPPDVDPADFACYDVGVHRCDCSAELCDGTGDTCTAAGGIWTDACTSCSCDAPTVDPTVFWACYDIAGSIGGTAHACVCDQAVLSEGMCTTAGGIWTDQCTECTYPSCSATDSGPPACAQDIDGSGQVGVDDLLSILAYFGRTTAADGSC